MDSAKIPTKGGLASICKSFLLRHGRIYPGLVLRECRQAIEDAEARLERLTQQVADVVSTWSIVPVVEPTRPFAVSRF